jgi:hypothetical protein
MARWTLRFHLQVCRFRCWRYGDGGGRADRERPWVRRWSSCSGSPSDTTPRLPRYVVSRKMRSPSLRVAAVLLLVGLGVFAQDRATGDAARIQAGEQDGSSDYASVVLDTFGPGEPAVVQSGGRTDDRLSRVLKPVVGTAVLLALAWALAARWCKRTARALWPGNVVCQRVAPRGPPVRLT